ncbi:hypothetical protein M413DRAFT_271565 [Hebeloma cylindrosporum]|uniref:Uncharacterized protein n=1 Tax=Hebeloma cylindrosporum TaxID=76867 RepID=A0A0C2Z1Z8_HEBCY|nr:hypothetical protein M413DRAFT_271565 [Hebeloma cylindrosporum h7]
MTRVVTSIRNVVRRGEEPRGCCSLHELGQQRLRLIGFACWDRKMHRLPSNVIIHASYTRYADE